MKKTLLTVALILLAALLAYGADPLSIQQMFQQSPKETAPTGQTSIITVRDNTVRRFSLYSTARFVPLATTTAAGVVKVGSGLAVDPDGTLRNTGIAGVASFNGRGGSVKPGFSDYSASMIKGLATVAKTGSYNNLADKPTIPAAQVPSDWNATSGAAQVLNKPTIPSQLSQLSDDATHRTVTDNEKSAWNSNSSPIQSVFGRTGAITAQQGDYTATDVGADPLGSATSVQEDLDEYKATNQAALNLKHSITAFNAYSTATQAKLGLKLNAANPVVSGPITTTEPDGKHRINVMNTVPRTFTPVEGDLDWDANGAIWIYKSGQWVDKTYVLPVASASVSGGVKVGNTLTMNNGVMDVMISSLGPSGLVTAGLAGDQTVSSGFAYVATATPWKATFNSYSSTKQTTVNAFGNYSGTVCAATGGKVYWSNPVTFANNSSACAKLRPGTRATVQHQGGRTLINSNLNLQKIYPPSTYTDDFTGANSTGMAAHDANWTNCTYTGSNGITTYMYIYDNAVREAAYRDSAAYYAASTSDTAQITVLPGTTSPTVNVRMSATSLGYDARFTTASGGNWTHVELYKNNVWLATYTGTWSQASNHTLKLTVSGTSTVTLHAFVDSADLGTKTDSASTIASGSPGFRIPNASGAVAKTLVDDWRDN